MKRVLKQLADKEDVTIVMTTPVPELVEELAHRVAIIRDGRLAHFDTPQGLCGIAEVEKRPRPGPATADLCRHAGHC